MGARLGPEIRVTNDPADTGCPRLVWNGARYAIAFSDGRFGATDVMLSFRDPAGAELGAVVQITNDGGASDSPAFTTNGHRRDEDLRRSVAAGS